MTRPGDPSDGQRWHHPAGLPIALAAVASLVVTLLASASPAAAEGQAPKLGLKPAGQEGAAPRWPGFS